MYTRRLRDPELFTQEREAIERYFRETNGSILDVGCGVGRVSHRLDERGFDVTGIDVSERMVEEARLAFPHIDFHVANTRDTSFDSNTFDYVVVSWFGLDYVLPKAERLEALQEIHRVLSPSEVLVFSSHNSWHKPLRRVMADFLLFAENRPKPFTRYRLERVPLGKVEI